MVCYTWGAVNVGDSSKYRQNTQKASSHSYTLISTYRQPLQKPETPLHLQRVADILASYPITYKERRETNQLDA
jgi:hypothetical protein